MTATVLGQQAVNALVLGSVYALIAVGLAMIYGVLRILHIAHAAMYTAGAYIGLFLYTRTGSLVLSVFGSMLAAGLFGIVFARLVYRPLLERPRIVTLIASIGVFICLSDIFRIVAGPHQLAFEVPGIATTVTMGGLSVSGVDMLVLGGTAVIFLALGFLLKHTDTGFSIRALAQDVETAKTMGIDTDRNIDAVFFIGSMIAAFGGITTGMLYNAVYTSMGDAVGYKGLALIVIGGFGSIGGAVIASFSLGLIETALTTYADIPLSRDGIAMLMLVLLILIRPQGLLGKE